MYRRVIDARKNKHEVNHLNYVICDDDPLFCSELDQRISILLGERSVDFNGEIYHSAEELLDAVEISKCDVFFLDIQMKAMDGITLGHTISSRAPDALIIYISALIEYGPQSHEIELTHRYLLKSRLDDTFSECMISLLHKLNLDENPVTFTFVDGELAFYLHEVLYLESRGHVVTFHFLSPRKEPQRLYAKLDDLEEKLEANSFLRIHKSFLVNMRYISSFLNPALQLTNGQSLPVSQRAFSAAKRRYFAYKAVGK